MGMGLCSAWGWVCTTAPAPHQNRLIAQAERPLCILRFFIFRYKTSAKHNLVYHNESSEFTVTASSVTPAAGYWAACLQVCAVPRGVPGPWRSVCRGRPWASGGSAPAGRVGVGGRGRGGAGNTA